MPVALANGRAKRRRAQARPGVTTAHVLPFTVGVTFNEVVAGWWTHQGHTARSFLIIILFFLSSPSFCTTSL